MKQYKVLLSRSGATAIEEGFLSEREAVRFLKSKGFQWDSLFQRWEQTYIYTDVYSDYEIDSTWTGAEIIELYS